MRLCPLVSKTEIVVADKEVVVGLKADRFTWIVIGVVAALLIAAIVSVNLAGDREQPAYLEENTPAAPVYNAFLALQQGDVTKARSYYSEDGSRGKRGLPTAGLGRLLEGGAILIVALCICCGRHKNSQRVLRD